MYIGSSKLHTAYSWISLGCLRFFINCASLKKSSGFIDPELQKAKQKENSRVDVIKDCSYLHRNHVGIAKIVFCNIKEDCYKSYKPSKDINSVEENV